MPISRTTVTASLDGAFTKALAVATGSVPLAVAMTEVYLDGSGDNLVDQYFHAKVAGSGATTYDLDAGTMLDDFGDAITWTAMHVLLVRNLATLATETLTLSGDFIARAAAWLGGTAPTFILPGGGTLLIQDPLGGLAVVAGTGDELILTPSTSLTWELHLLGTD